MIPVLDRSLSVMLDGESFSFSGRAAEGVSSALTATSIVAAPHRGERSFRLTSPLTRFPPQAVVSGSPTASARPMLTPSGLMVVSATSIGATPHRGARNRTRTADAVASRAPRAEALIRLTSAQSEFPPLAADSASPVRGLSEAVRISETDLADTVAFAGGPIAEPNRWQSSPLLFPAGVPDRP